MKVVILGCGTSSGVPRLGNHWGQCDPLNPKNRRRRVSILVADRGTQLLVDTSPDLREQCLEAGITELDGVLYTHDHADHTHGIDDLRALVHMTGNKVPVFADQATGDVLTRRFDYIFKDNEGYPAIAQMNIIRGPLSFGNISVTPFEQIHGNGMSLGFRFGEVAYSTDLNGLSDAAFETLAGVRVWIVDALRYAPHPTHAHLDLTLSWIERVKPERAILTHMTWDMDYETLRKILPLNVEPAYDGMEISL